MASPVRVIIRDRFYIPAGHVDIRRLRAIYEIPLITKEDCHPSCPLATKVGRYCARCPSKDARVIMWERVTTRGGNTLIAVPAGSMRLLRKLLAGSAIEFIDRRTNVPFRSNIRWCGRLHRAGEVDRKGRPLADQRGMLYKWRRHVDAGDTGGIIISPPRSGKTVVGVAGTLMHRVRTLISASEINFLRQFGKRFGENTNVRSIARGGRSPVVLVDPKGWPDGPRYGIQVVKKWGKETTAADVVLSTYQQLIDVGTRGDKFRLYVVDKFGKLMCDETHQTAAKAFQRVVNRTNARYKMGLTATIHRKDGLEPCCHPDSILITKDGIMKISDVNINDRILAHNHTTGANEYSRVLEKHFMAPSKMIRVSFGDDSVIVTPNHRFWSVTRQAYVCAADLEPSDELLLATPSKTCDPS